MTTDYLLRDGYYFRAGLVFEADTIHAWNCNSGETDDAEQVFFYEPDGPFFVDGIRYERPADNGVQYTRTMIEVFPDGGGGPSRYDPEPVSEAQLDRWVRQGGHL